MAIAPETTSWFWSQGAPGIIGRSLQINKIVRDSSVHALALPEHRDTVLRALHSQ